MIRSIAALEENEGTSSVGACVGLQSSPPAERSRSGRGGAVAMLRNYEEIELLFGEDSG